MTLIVLEPPQFEPVTVAEAFLHLRLGWDAVEELDKHPFYPEVVRRIRSARLQVEQMTGRALVQQKLRYTARCFTCRGVMLPRPPLIEVLSAGYYTSTDDLVVLTEDDWFVESASLLRLQSTVNLGCLAGRSDAVFVDYLAGYPPEGSPPDGRDDFVANVPDLLRDAILIGIELLGGAMSPADREGLERQQEAAVVSFRVHSGGT